ncbi:MAG: hypothetical protein ACRDJ9_32750 [Dehalococcoidia bacterium]
MERFLTHLLISAGVLPSQAAQLARAYLAAHGVPLSAITAENILQTLGFELAGGGRVQQTVGALSLTGPGTAVLLAVELVAPTEQEQQEVAEAAAAAAGGAVSSQTIQAFGLSPLEAATFGQLQGQSLGSTGIDVVGGVDTGTYAFLESQGFLDDIDTDDDNFTWWS